MGPRRLLAVLVLAACPRFARPRCCGFTSSNLRGPVHASAVNRACGGSGLTRIAWFEGTPESGSLRPKWPQDARHTGGDRRRRSVRGSMGMRGREIVGSCRPGSASAGSSGTGASAEDLRRVTRAGGRASCGRMGRKLLDSGLPSNHAIACSPGPPQTRFRHFPGRGARASIRVNPQQRGRAKRGHAARTEPGSKPSHPSEANSARRQCGDRASRPAPRVTRPRRRARDPRSDRRRVRRRRTRG